MSNLPRRGLGKIISNKIIKRRGIESETMSLINEKGGSNRFVSLSAHQMQSPQDSEFPYDSNAFAQSAGEMWTL
jgi:hypothetical protein